MISVLDWLKAVRASDGLPPHSLDITDKAIREIERLRSVLREIDEEPLDSVGHGDAKRIAREALSAS